MSLYIDVIFRTINLLVTIIFNTVQLGVDVGFRTLSLLIEKSNRPAGVGSSLAFAGLSVGQVQDLGFISVLVDRVSEVIILTVLSPGPLHNSILGLEWIIGSSVLSGITGIFIYAMTSRI